MWVAIILLGVSGFMSGDVKTIAQIPMQSRQACDTFASNMQQSSGKTTAVICISSENGETFTKIGNK